MKRICPLCEKEIEQDEPRAKESEYGKIYHIKCYLNLNPSIDRERREQRIY